MYYINTGSYSSTCISVAVFIPEGLGLLLFVWGVFWSLGIFLRWGGWFAFFPLSLQAALGHFGKDKV